LASLSTLSLHAMFVYALNFWIVTLCLDELIGAMMCVLGWLYCEEGCLKWLSRRYIRLRLSVKINVSMFRGLVCSIARSSA
jgi:hypothetical protein